MRGAILAGGNASRFGGEPKGLAKVGGERILDRVVNALRSATGQAPLLVANAENANDWRPDLEVIPDAIRDCGSLGGIYTALIAGDGPVLVVAWDMPFLSDDLLAELARRSVGFDVFLPVSTSAKDGLEPLCGVYTPACIDHIRKQIADEDLRASGFLDAVSLGKLPEGDVARFGEMDMLFFNVNTQSDLERAQDLWRSRHEH